MDFPVDWDKPTYAEIRRLPAAPLSEQPNPSHQHHARHHEPHTTGTNTIYLISPAGSGTNSPSDVVERFGIVVGTLAIPQTEVGTHASDNSVADLARLARVDTQWIPPTVRVRSHHRVRQWQLVQNPPQVPYHRSGHRG